MPVQHYLPDTYRPCSSVGYLLKRAYSLLLDRLDPVIEAGGLTFTQWVALVYLREGMEVNAQTLCAQLRHDSGAITRLIDQLESRELLKRERSRRDRRSVQLHLTPKGRQTIEALIPDVVAQLNQALSPLSAAEFGELTRLLTKLIGALEGKTEHDRTAQAQAGEPV